MRPVPPIIEHLLSCLLLLGQQVPQREIIYNILHILDPVLQSVAAAAQAVVLQVENLEASEEVLDELIDEERTLVVTKSDRIACKASLSTLSASLHMKWQSGQRTSSSTSEIRDCRYSSRVRWNSSRSFRFTGTGHVSFLPCSAIVVPTLQDLAQLLNRKQTPSLDLSAVVLIATQPAPEKKAFNLSGGQFCSCVESK